MERVAWTPMVSWAEGTGAVLAEAQNEVAQRDAEIAELRARVAELERMLSER